MSASVCSICYPWKKIAETSEFISQKEDINSLEKEYSHEDIIYQTKIKVCPAEKVFLEFLS